MGGCDDGGYIKTDSLGISEALSPVARALGGAAGERSIDVPARRVNAEPISADYKLFADMTLGLLYMLTGRWCRCEITQGDTVRIRYIDDNAAAPRALRMLKDAIRAYRGGQ